MSRTRARATRSEAAPTLELNLPGLVEMPVAALLMVTTAAALRGYRPVALSLWRAPVIMLGGLAVSQRRAGGPPARS